MRVAILGIDGFLGWPLALHLASKGHRVSGVDNFDRRAWVEEVGGHSVVPIFPMAKRLDVAKGLLGLDIEFRLLDVKNQWALQAYLQGFKPDTIVHYAECPSAPFSMIDAEHAKFVQENNVLGTLGLLFAMRDVCPEATLLKLGTMGEYGTPPSGRPLFEGHFPGDAYLKWRGQEWSLGGEMTPRNAGSFYHITKVQDTHNVMKACEWWGLRSYDIMQGVIFGVHTDQIAADPRLRTRLDIDEWFGTVVNRMIAQAVIGIPLTIYGQGGQTRGMIALEDAMQCMALLIENPPRLGEYRVVNQLSGFHSVSDVAEVIADVGQVDFGLDVEIMRYENPRVELERHRFNPVHERLAQLGFQPRVSLRQAIRRAFSLLVKPEIKQRIEAKRDLILPETWWSGEKRKIEWLSS